jgi:hypothetical protein
MEVSRQVFTHWTNLIDLLEWGGGAHAFARLEIEECPTRQLLPKRDEVRMVWWVQR